MRVGIVLHGPEIVDIGSAKRIINIFRQEHEVVAKLGGTMGRTAVLDAGLEDIIDISQGLTPSETITALKGAIDLAVLLNHGKTLETGLYFGGIIASKLGTDPPFVHIERPDCDGRIVYYFTKARECAEYVVKMLTRHDEKYNLPVAKGRCSPSHIRVEGGTVIRRISGVFAGESIRLDGVVIGVAAQNEPEIVCKDGRVVALRGGRIKPHGIEKLENRSIDLFTARVRTGNIRRTRHTPRIKKVASAVPAKIAIIDHCAEHTFELIKDAGTVITVGDDTTAIASDILARVGIPVIGIIDGDLDCVLVDTAIPAKSVIIRVREGCDDLVGRKVFEKLMCGSQQIKAQSSDEILARILALAEKYIISLKYY